MDPRGIFTKARFLRTLSRGPHLTRVPDGLKVSTTVGLDSQWENFELLGLTYLVYH